MAHPEKKVKEAAEQIFIRYKTYYILGSKLDAIVCYKGKFLAVEFKAGYNSTTALQEREINAIHKAGGAAMVVREDTLDELERWFVSNG